MNRQNTVRTKDPSIQHAGLATICIGLVILLAAAGLLLLGIPAYLAFFLGGFVELLGWMVMLKA